MTPTNPTRDARGPRGTTISLAALAAILVARAAATAADPDPARVARERALAADQAAVRLAIAALRPADTALESLAKATAESDKPLLDAAIATRTRAVAAGNAYLALLVPETDPAEIERCGDEWIRVQNELELANLALAFANERQRLAVARGAEQAAAAVAMPEIVRRDDERLAARRALLEANLRLRIAERARRVAGRDFEEILRQP